MGWDLTFLLLQLHFLMVDLYRPRCVLGLFFEEQIVGTKLWSGCCGGRCYFISFLVHVFLVVAVPSGPFIYLAFSDLDFDGADVIAL